MSLVAKFAPLAMAAMADPEVRALVTETAEACMGALERSGAPVRLIQGLNRDRGTGLATNTLRAALKHPEVRAWVRKNRRRAPR